MPEELTLLKRLPQHQIHRQIKSFGLVEAMIASVIVVIILTGALALASSANRSVALDSSYTQAAQIGEDLFGRINILRSTGKLDFTGSGNGVSIDCFDSTKFHEAGSSCSADISALPIKLDLLQEAIDASGFAPIGHKSDDGNLDVLKNPAFPPGFFRLKTTVWTPADGCRGADSLQIAKEKCRFVKVEIRWNEQSGEKAYNISEYITDWQR